MVDNAIGRIQIGTLLLGAVVAGFTVAWGRSELALPLLGGLVWGMFNVHLLRKLSEYLRPDREKPAGMILLLLAVKMPIMYLAAFVLLRGRPLDSVVAAAFGFTLVLLVIVLRGLGAMLLNARRPRDVGRV